MLTSRIKMYFKFLVSKTLLFYFLESEIIRVIENKEWGKRKKSDLHKTGTEY